TGGGRGGGGATGRARARRGRTGRGQHTTTEGGNLMNWSRSFKASVAVGLLAVSASAVAGPSGAIFTTDKNSSFVNANVYDEPGDVYVNGGPRANAPCTAAGLPDGEYAFQVTDPSGQDVLSEDAIDHRGLVISGGVITNTLNFTTLGPSSHGTGTGKCPGSITVQLCPFTLRTDGGDEYKVWITPASALSVGGFARNMSKTDNFKV